MSKGFYGLRAVLLMGVFMALLREPNPARRARPGYDRSTWAASWGWTGPRRSRPCAASSPSSPGTGGARSCRPPSPARHATTRPDAVGFLYLDGHVRVYSGTRVLPKTHIARMRIAGPATEETWVGDADGDPVMVLTAAPSQSLAAELRRTLPDLRAIVGPDRACTVVFDRGGYSPAVFAEIVAAGFDLLTYYKGAWARTPQDTFTTTVFVTPDATKKTYQLAERPIELVVPAVPATPSAPARTASKITSRLIVRRSPDGHQTPILTSRTDLSAAEIAYRMAARWRQENYFKYARHHFALDALDSYADQGDDLERLVPNPAKATALARVAQARTDLATAHAQVSAAIDAAAARARQPGSGGTATVDPAADNAQTAAETALADAQTASRATPSHLPLGQVRPGTRLLETERKLLTHAIRMSAYNTESALARLLRPHYARGQDEARSLLREAFTLPGDLQLLDDTLHVRLDPASAPRRSRALAALCAELTDTETRYPGTNLTLTYSIKQHP